MPNFTIELEKLPSSNESLAVIHAKGKISMETVGELLKLRAESAQRLILDMSGITFLDSSGAGGLVSLFVSRRNQGKQFVLAALSQQATAVVTVAGLQNVLPVYRTVEEATTKSANA
jgi:anti-sigma B factor antagonist